MSKNGFGTGLKKIKAGCRPNITVKKIRPPDMPWSANILTLVPESYPGILAESVIGRALKQEKWSLSITNLRDFGFGKHNNVDDTPAGGGAGMIIRADVVGNALEEVLNTKSGANYPLICLSPRGKKFDQSMARNWASQKGIILTSGRFGGIDQRVIDYYQMQEVSIGDFVMTGGELAAQAMLDATIRLLPGVLGNHESLENESHSNGLLEYPQYTRPYSWRNLKIPNVLRSGDHKKIFEWRLKMAEKLTKKRRPDL